MSQQSLFISEQDKAETLKNFMLEHFDFDGLKKAGFYGKDIKRKDYQKQADRVCHFFGYETVYEYNAKTTYCHLSYGDVRPLKVNEKGELKEEPFITVFKGWMDE